MTGHDETASPLTEELAYPTEAILRCPYEFFTRLRQEAPVFQVPNENVYLVAKAEDIRYVTRNPRIFSSHFNNLQSTDPSIIAVRERGWSDAFTLQKADPPKHAFYREAVASIFKPSAIRKIEPNVREICDTLIDAFVADGHADLVAQFATLLPSIVIADLLGVPRENAEDYRLWSRNVIDMASHVAGSSVSQARALEYAEGDVEQQYYWYDVIDRRRKAPADDFVTELINVRAPDGASLSDEELIDILRTLLEAGNNTTAHSIGYLLALLLTHPHQLDLLVGDRSLVPQAVEEALRFESVLTWRPRLVKMDTELGGVAIPAGSYLRLLWPSASRDESMFVDADKFDITRDGAKRHLAFGYGIHHCVGAPLARLEMVVALEQVLARLPHLRLAVGPESIGERPHMMFRMIDRIDAVFDDNMPAEPTANGATNGGQT